MYKKRMYRSEKSVLSITRKRTTQLTKIREKKKRNKSYLTGRNLREEEKKTSFIRYKNKTIYIEIFISGD